MKIALFILALLAFITVVVMTRHLWDRPKETVDMMKKFDTIVKRGCALGEGGRILELRENFVMAGFRNEKGEKAYLVKQRPDNEFRVIYISRYDREHHDLKFSHVYKDDYDQNLIIEQFEREIAEFLVKRK